MVVKVNLLIRYIIMVCFIFTLVCPEYGLVAIKIHHLTLRVVSGGKFDRIKLY